jgi:hypothetical protein
MRRLRHRSRHAVWSAALFALLVIPACAGQLEPVRRPAFTVGVLPVGLDRMGQAIKNGAAAAGWTVIEEKPGKIDAEVKLSGEKAIVYITYSDIDYSINLKQVSEGLDYDGQKIHKRYNYWVDRLSRAIQAELKKKP